jgi:hypothetical protein
MFPNRIDGKLWCGINGIILNETPMGVFPKDDRDCKLQRIELTDGEIFEPREREE